MFKRELTRIAVMAILGFIVGLGILFSDGEGSRASFLLIMPLYFIGIFYGWKILLKMIGTIVSMYFNYQMMSLFMKPLGGTIICVMLLIVGIGLVLSLGWIAGIFKCIHSLIMAYQIDRQCNMIL